MKEQLPQSDPRKVLPEKVQLYLSFGDRAHDETRTNQERVIFDMRQLDVFDGMTNLERDALANYGTGLSEQIAKGMSVKTVHTLEEHI